MKSAPERLADELRGDRWTLMGARFHGTNEQESFTAAIVLDAGSCSSWISLASSCPQTKRALRELARAGYRTFDGEYPFARRVLRGLREVRAEVVRLENAMRDPNALTVMPRRKQRPLHHSRTPVSAPILKYMRRLKQWSWQVTRLERRGKPCFVDGRLWGVVAWCWSLTYEATATMGVQVYAKDDANPNDAECARAKSALRRLLTPFGYRLLQISWRGRVPKLFIVEKSVRTLTAARRERMRLDELVFGALVLSTPSNLAKPNSGGGTRTRKVARKGARRRNEITLVQC